LEVFEQKLIERNAYGHRLGWNGGADSVDPACNFVDTRARFLIRDHVAFLSIRGIVRTPRCGVRRAVPSILVIAG